MNYYETLGVPKHASSDEIKKAYRSAAMKHHPDRGGDAGKFKEIEEAYRTLSDDQARAQYDQPQPNYHHYGNGAPAGFESFFSAFGPEFSNMFRPQRVRNRDLNFQTKIQLEDSFFGRDIVLQFFKANGQEKVVNVTIPKGIHSGQTLRLSGVGDDSLPSAPAGDVLVNVEILPHREFRREGDDLIKDIEISCFDAILGAEIQIQTLDQKTFNGTIPAGTQPDSILNINGQGMPNINNPAVRGRLLLNIKMTIPKLDESQKNILRQIVR